MTIISFGDPLTERLDRTGTAPGVPSDIIEKALQRLGRLDATTRLDFLAQPAGMRLRKARSYGPDFFLVHVKARWWLRFRWGHPDCFAVSLIEKNRRRRKR